MNRALTRREILKQIAAAGLFAPAILAGSRGRARAALPPLPNISPNDALLLRPGDSGFDANVAIYNQRTILRPQLRARCKTPQGVAAMVDWARTNNVPFVSRSGGHCYEDFSQTTDVVIDTSLMDKVQPSGDTATVGAGASLGKVYRTIAPLKLALPAGSCPTVGVSGHVLGGGFGYLGRPFGLACDSLEWIELVDPQGQIIQADAQQNPDLFWACRGGGGGSFGIATRYRFKLHQVPHVVVFKIDWYLNPANAAKIVKAWQAWAPQAPKTITSILRFGKQKNGKINVHCGGQSVGSAAEVARELKHLHNVAKPDAVPNITTRTFQWVVDHIYKPITPTPMFFKCKSDYVLTPMSDQGIATLIDGVHSLPFNAIVPICDAYGGAVFDVAPDATAFPHRAGTLYGIQYYANWKSSGDTQTRVQQVRDLYDSMRPYVSGAAYVNYCDKDLTNWPDAYWGANLTRLKQIKTAFDPGNVFHHAQSVPLAS